MLKNNFEYYETFKIFKKINNHAGNNYLVLLSTQF